MTEPDRDPVETLLDLVFYAPIGAFFHGSTVVAELAQKGRAQVANAKVVGGVAVDRGRTEISDVAHSVQTQLCDLFAAAARAAGVPMADTDPTQTSDTGDPPASSAPDSSGSDGSDINDEASHTGFSAVLNHDATEVATDVANVSVVVESDGPPVHDLPIPDYDNLSASQVVPRLEDLADDELEAVRSYEAAHRSRMTILSRIAQLQAS